MPVAPNDDLALIWAPSGQWMVVYATPSLPGRGPAPLIADTRRTVVAAFYKVKNRGTTIIAAYLFNELGYVTALVQPPHLRDIGYT